MRTRALDTRHHSSPRRYIVSPLRHLGVVLACSVFIVAAAVPDSDTQLWVRPLIASLGIILAIVWFRDPHSVVYSPQDETIEFRSLIRRRVRVPIMSIEEVETTYIGGFRRLNFTYSVPAPTPRPTNDLFGLTGMIQSATRQTMRTAPLVRTSRLYADLQGHNPYIAFVDPMRSKRRLVLWTIGGYLVLTAIVLTAMLTQHP